MENGSTNSIIKRIAFVGNYLPRRCGIATFTTDLCEAIAAEYEGTTCIALPVNDTDDGYEYPSRVRFELTEKDIESYRRAADWAATSWLSCVNCACRLSRLCTPFWTNRMQISGGCWRKSRHSQIGSLS